MNTQQFEALKKKLETEQETVTQNKGRLQQLKETAKATFKVDSIEDLRKLKTDYETDMDMQKTKKQKQIEKLEAIVPKEVMDAIYEL